MDYYLCLSHLFTLRWAILFHHFDCFKDVAEQPLLFTIANILAPISGYVAVDQILTIYFRNHAFLTFTICMVASAKCAASLNNFSV